jgi:rare lipoprotein A
VDRLRTIAAIGILLLANGAATGAAFAQSFEERWSPIPKAHAEPATPPASDSQKQPDEPAVSEPQTVETPRAEAPKGTSTASGRRHKAGRHVFTGKASYYTYRGGRTASGQPFSRDALTAAHRTLPFGTRVRVTDIKTNKSVDVVITDRGPAARGRVLDLSLGAAKALDIGARGVIHIRAEIIS